MITHEETMALHKQLLENIKTQLPELKKLYEKVSRHLTYEEHIYRMYHYSFKVYYTQSETVEITKALADLMPGRPFNEFFKVIFTEGTGHTFDFSHNEHWLRHTRPIIEAYFHARHMLEMAIKYGETLQEPPTMLPFGWGTVLYLFDLR